MSRSLTPFKKRPEAPKPPAEIIDHQKKIARLVRSENWGLLMSLMARFIEDYSVPIPRDIGGLTAFYAHAILKEGFERFIGFVEAEARKLPKDELERLEEKEHRFE